MVNPPYGARIGDRNALFSLYAALGKTWEQHFPGWRLALVTADPGLASATSKSLKEGPSFSHGGLRLRLYLGG